MSYGVTDRSIRARRVLHLRAQGHASEAIASAIGISLANVRRDLKAAERAECIIALRAGGSSLEEIAPVFGVTRERIRQIEAVYGGYVAPGHRPASIDPSQLLRVIRNPESRSFTAAIRHTGCGGEEAKECLTALGMLAAVERLYRMRKHKRQEENRYARQQPMIDAAQKLAKELGRTPTLREMSVAVFGVDYRLQSGGRLASQWAGKSLGRSGVLPAMRHAMGFPEVGGAMRGRKIMRLGIVIGAVRRLGKRSQGFTKREIVRATGTTFGSVNQTIHAARQRGEIRVKHRLNGPGRAAVYEAVP